MRIAGVAVLVLGLCVACNSLASKGTMPPPGPGGLIDPSAVPDFVAVAGPQGTAGYVAKQAVLDGGDRSWPVYAADLTTVVGQMVPGRGFVPAGVDPSSVPLANASVAPAPAVATESSEVVRAYVRNGSSTEVSVAVLNGAGSIQPGAASFPSAGYIGVACLSVPIGSRMVVLDRPPTEAGASARQTIYVGATVSEPVIRWIDLAADGTLRVGDGTPSWWTGDPRC